MNTRKICVFDFETDGTNPHECNPVQLGALMIDTRKLVIVPDSEFCTNIQPPGIIKPEEYLTEGRKDTIAWHAKNYGVTSEDIIQRWTEAVDEKTAWQLFLTYFKKYNPGKTMFSAPMLGGMNIRGFDVRIFERLMKKYGTSKFYWPRDQADLMDWCFLWLESLEEPKKYNMEVLRKFFGISTKGSHDALKDVRDTAQLLIKFMQLTRKYASGVQFKGACKT